MSQATTPTWLDYTEPSFVEVGGVRTAYRRKGTGEPLLYLHGAGLTRRWLPLYEELAGSFDVIVPEHPGFGDSELPDWATDFGDLAIHYDELLDLLGVGRVHVVGHSFGGWVAAEFAAYYPKRLRSLTLISPLGLRPDEGEPMTDLFRGDPATMPESILGADAERWLAYLDEGDPAAQMIQEYRELTGLARFAWNPRYDIKLDRRLTRVTAPTQVIVPEHDGIVSPSVPDRYVAAIPDARKVVVGDDAVPTEHLVIIQQPVRIAERIRRIAKGTDA